MHITKVTDRSRLEVSQGRETSNATQKQKKKSTRLESHKRRTSSYPSLLESGPFFFAEKMPDAKAYLEKLKASSTFADEVGKLEHCYQKKLWHQLTLALLDLVKSPTLSGSDDLRDLYENFVVDFEHRINQLSLVRIALAVAASFGNAEEATKYLSSVAEKVKTHAEASILCRTNIARIKLGTEDLEPLKRVVEDLNKDLDALDTVTTTHGEFYKLSSEYYRRVGNHASYYRDALRYLGCTDLEELSENERAEAAFRIGVAALLGEGVYNFGELLAHPVLESLRNSERRWLVDLLLAFNSGNMAQFEADATWKSLPDLQVAERHLRRKLSLLSLMEMIFARPSAERSLSFSDISAASRVPVDEVEMLVMRALSLGLVKGSIDEVQQTAHMTWVQPRVLDRTQLGTMRTRLQEWCTRVQKTAFSVEDQVP